MKVHSWRWKEQFDTRNLNSGTRNAVQCGLKLVWTFSVKIFFVKETGCTVNREAENADNNSSPKTCSKATDEATVKGLLLFLLHYALKRIGFLQYKCKIDRWMTYMWEEQVQRWLILNVVSWNWDFVCVTNWRHFYVLKKTQIDLNLLFVFSHHRMFLNGLFQLFVM